MKGRIKKISVIAVCLAMILCTFTNANVVKATDDGYEIYPNPQSITYGTGDFILRDNVNVVYEDGIDQDTKNRLQEVTDLKNLSITTSNEIKAKTTNILVGIHGSNGYVDKYVQENCQYSNGLFDNLDAYYLQVNDGTIVVLGKDSDAAFYGLTTLYMVVGQLDSRTIKNFTIEDYANVASRGFIEGYYGNPWSTQDRINLMTWGGYYKLNSYFYAPKDDPKHNSKWRELYSDEEIENKIKPLAKAGNKSKCRFVFALHPFMNSPISFTQSQYSNDLAILQAKFEQVIKAGVRQIAILADDAANYNNTGDLGGNNYKRLLEDMTAWLKEMQVEYPDLKLTLPFCPVEYGGTGQDYYRDFPDNVQIVMTGGRVWGEVSNNFTSTFTNNVGRGPYMWINWPCTDNSKKHLIMGGYETFLQPGVDPQNIQGIVLNPMQQSEPSKVAIFGNACYSWNIWDSKEEANATWEDSFKYVDHNSAIETDASNALKELSKHMINQAMDSRVTALEESIVLKEKLNSFKSKLENGTLSEADIDSMIDEFEILQSAAKTYRLQAGNSDIASQIVYWLDCWDDTTEAAIAYLNGVKAVLNNDTNGILQYESAGKTAFDRSKTHGFNYVDHIEYAEVGVQHIVPFINTLATYVSQYAQTAMDPDKVVTTFITNRSDSPVGSSENVFDGDDGTMVSYRNPVWIYKGDYVGVKYNKNIKIENIRFLLGNGKNHFEASKLQYTTDGKQWQDLELVDMDNQFTGIRNQYLEVNVKKENLPENFEAMGIRLIATADNELDAYLNVHEIQINQKSDAEEVTGEYSTNRDRMNGTAFDVLSDGQNGNSSDNEVWLSVASGSDKDKLPAGSYLAYTFNSKQKISSVHFAQGGSASGDVISDGSLQYLDDEGNWITIGDVTNQQEQVFDLSDQNIETTALRIHNDAFAGIWWRVGEFRVDVQDDSGTTPLEYNVIKTQRWKVYQGPESRLYDGNDNTYVWYDPDGDGNSTGDDFLAGDYLGYDFGKVATLKSVHIVVGNDNGDKLVNYAIETSLDNNTWTAIDGYDNYQGNASGKDTIDIKLDGLKARYIRIRNLANQGSWGKFSEFTVEEVSQSGSKDYLYTNLDNTSILSNLEGNTAWLTPGNVTLAKDQYIGIDLKNIKHITSIEALTLPESCRLEVSKNGIEWSNFDTASDGRYVRIVNPNDQKAVLDLSKFEVVFDYIGEKTVTSDFANQQTSNDMRTAGTVNNVFDGDLSTIGMINGPQEQGKHITFDLGQTIHFESIRYYITESQLNYIRDADFEVSVDNKTWTKVLHVGKPVENVWDDTVAKDMQDITLYHDSQNPGYMYAQATDLNVDGRYIRVTPTSTYSHRWVGFNEIQINGGAYISPESNRDIISEAIEEPGKIPSNMIDKDYSTSYKSTAANSSFTYYVSQPVDLRTVRIVQSGTISNAKVIAHVYSEGTVKEINLGSLNQTISEFVIPEGVMFKDIQVSWQDSIPEILEIAMYKTAEDATDAKADLKALLDENIDTSNWTLDSLQNYQNAYIAAKEIYENEYASKFTVETALGVLKTAINNGEEKYTDSKLSDLVNNAISNDKGYYTTVSYNAYNSAILSAQAALENPDLLSKEDGEQLVAAIEKAQSELVYSTAFREQAQLLVEEELVLIDDVYSPESLEAYNQAKADLKEAIDKDKAASSQEERVSPETFESLINAYNDAKAKLQASAKATLQVLIDEFATYDGDLYEQESFAAYQKAVEKAKEIIETATTEEIVEQIQAIREAKSNLKASKATLDEVIKDAEAVDKNKYTEKSYNDLMNIVNEAKNLTDESEYAKYIQLITDAKTALVNVEVLKARISEVEKIDATLYTKASYQKVSETLATAKLLLVDGSQDDVETMLETLIDAVNGLELSGQKEYEQYLSNIELKDEALYTEDSYKVYKDAYDNLANLGDDVSLKDFTNAKTIFEEAQEALKFKGADYSKVQEVLDRIPADLSGFDQAAVKELKDLIASIDYTLTINDQEKVDKYAIDLQAALDKVLKSMNPDDGSQQPEQPGQATGDKDTTNSSSSAKTGDTAVILPSLLLMSLAVLMGTFVKRRKVIK